MSIFTGRLRHQEVDKKLPKRIRKEKKKGKEPKRREKMAKLEGQR